MRLRRAARLLVALAAAALGLALARPAPIVAVDQDQPRLNVAAPLPRPVAPLAQTFVAGRAGLSAVEVLAVVYEAQDSAPRLTLRLRDSAGVEVAAAQFAGFNHNDPLRLSFAPQPRSQGQRYTLVAEGAAAGGATLWAYSLDGYTDGALLAGAAHAAGDLRFTTHYTLQASAALQALGAGLAHLARLALPLWLILFVPGLLVLRGTPWPNAWTRLGMALGLSLALLALLWLWAGVLGLRLSRQALAFLYGGLGLAWLLFAAWGLWRRRAALAWPGGHDAALAAALLAGLAARLLAARDLAFAPWVDSPHHFLIARLLAEGGGVPAGYQPLLPVQGFHYHFGYHALLVAAAWLAGLPLEAAMLPLGQALNALAPLAAYALVAGLTARPRAALVGAFFVACVSYFPGYYLAWGRYSQLAGILILAPALAAAWRALQPGRAAGLRGLVAEAGLPALLAAGLLLTHYRLAVLWGLFVLALLAWRWRSALAWSTLGAAAGVSALLAGPWLARLGVAYLPRVAAEPASLAAQGAYNAFPFEYFSGWLERGWLALALAALAWGVVRRERALLVVAAWVALTFGVLNLGPGTWVVNNNAWAITLFLPGAVAVGWGLDCLLGLQVENRRWGFAGRWLAPAGQALAAGLLAFAGLRGWTAQANLVRPVTVLAVAADRAALAWVQSETSPEAVFLVNGWQWLGRAWASPDGGAWLWALAGRRATLPPVDYVYQPDWASAVRDFNEAAAEAFPQGVDTPQALALLRQAGVTHVYIGAKGGALRPEAFALSPAYRLVYSNGGAWVFEFLAN